MNKAVVRRNSEDRAILVPAGLLLILYMVISLGIKVTELSELLEFIYEEMAVPVICIFLFYRVLKADEIVSITKEYFVMYLATGIFLNIFTDVEDRNIVSFMIFLMIFQVAVIRKFITCINGSLRNKAIVLFVGILIFCGLVALWGGSLNGFFGILLPMEAIGFIFAASLYTRSDTERTLQTQKLALISCMLIAVMMITYFFKRTGWRMLIMFGEPAGAILLPLILNTLYELLCKFWKKHRKFADIAVSISYFGVCLIGYAGITLINIYLNTVNTLGRWAYVCLVCVVIFLYKTIKVGTRQQIFKYIYGALCIFGFLFMSGLILFLTNIREREILFHLGLEPYNIWKICREDWFNNNIYDAVAVWYGSDSARIVGISRWLLLFTIVTAGTVLYKLAKKHIANAALREQRNCLLIGYIVQLILHCILTIGIVGEYIYLTVNSGARVMIIEFIFLIFFLLYDRKCSKEQEKCSGIDMKPEGIQESIVR